MANQKKWADMTKKEKKSGIIGVIVLVFIVFAVVSALTGGNKAVNDANKAVSNLGGNDAQAAPATTPVQTEPVATPAPATKVPAEYKSALSQAGSYSSTMHMSKQGVYDQLVSEYGGKFTAEAAQYAIDNVKADWNANALAKAKSYQDTMHQSPAAIHDQLTSEYGEKFTQVEADYAIQHLND